MVGHHFVEALAQREILERFHVTILGEEPRLAYDRVNLSKFFDGAEAAELQLASAERYRQLGVTTVLGDPVTRLDRQAKSLRTQNGLEFYYDKLVLATGSYPFVPAIEGRDLPGCFVYRTLDDLEAIRAFAASCRSGVVVGGGLLGLEAANALKSLQLETHVVECAARLMPLQVDDTGGEILRGRIEQLGVHVHLSKTTTRIVGRHAHGLARMEFSDGEVLGTDMVVFSAGIRARDELGRKSGLRLGKRGGLAIDRLCTTSDPDILAIGECAAFEDMTYGLVAPGYRMAEVAADVLAGQENAFTGFDMSAKLKLLGVDVASFGDAFATTSGSKKISMYDAVQGTYKKLVVSADQKRLLGGVLVGDASSYAELCSYVQNNLPLPERPEHLVIPPNDGAKGRMGVEALPQAATICSCHNLDKANICDSIRQQRLAAIGDIKRCTKAGTGCGSCVPLLGELLKSELKRAGVEVTNHLCEHFKYSRQELYHLVLVGKIKTFGELLARHGAGSGCEICKPAVASILASTENDYILNEPHAGLQDTNDRFLANVQRDGTYSVVPRIAAGEVTPKQLMHLGRIAEKYGLYTKITGAQRIDMFGARLEQLPKIWGELVAAGFESGHAYGKALRTVKSCVGSTWCRYGVQDSVALALRIENRYKGLRSPHKLKGAVSGCARECAEAQGKDFGVIATEKGFNLYLCGNGGMKPQHAVLFATDIDADTVIKYLDRFLMFYVRTADRLQRTANWFNQLEGGIEYLRKVIIDDSLGICAELEAQMAHLIETYQCEWKATVEDPRRLRMFRAFVNSGESDPSVVFVKERAQHRPAFWAEKQALLRASRADSQKIQLPVLGD